jgi:hypothetical protein
MQGIQRFPVKAGYALTYRLNNIYKFSAYFTGNTLRLRYKAQPVNAV